MTDRELEQRLRAFYAAEVGAAEAAPVDLRESVGTIPAATPIPLRPRAGRRSFTLLAAAAVLVVGGALAAGSGYLRLTSGPTPAPSLAVAVPPTTIVAPPSAPLSETPALTANVRPGGLIAFVRNVDKVRACRFGKTAPCSTPRVWIIGTDGSGAHEVVADGVGIQTLLGWSSDGTRLLYSEADKLFLVDPTSGQPQPVDTGCNPPSPTTPLSCQRDSQVALSGDGRHIVFVRESTYAQEHGGVGVIATMDLESGRVLELNSTAQLGAVHPGWSPDGQHIVFFLYAGKDDGGPVPPSKGGVFVIDADGENLGQVTPTTLAAQDAAWSPDGERIVFMSPDPVGPGNNLGDIYTIRPDGTDVRRLTSDALSASPSWTADGRILFARASSGAGGWWTMDADGTNVAPLLSAAAIGVAPESVGYTVPAWQQIGGAAMVPPPWTPSTAITVGPPAPTPSPTPTPDLAPGFSWTASPVMPDGTALGNTATRLSDGRVLVTAGCSTAASLYDPSNGTFTPTGSMSVVRASTSATLLHDGRVLFAGGYTCGNTDQDGMWATAELYDPSMGTFSPTGSLTAPRSQHTATLLADGRVLIAGGMTGNRATTAGAVTFAAYRTAETDSGFLATAEIYDPATRTFSKTGSMSTAHRGHTATLLQDGRVLVVGNGGESTAASTVADVYDPATGRFSRTGSLRTGRWLQTATLLQDGRVLILGGRSSNDSVHTSAEMYDPRSGTFLPAGSMREGRQQHTATLLPDGRVFITGGYWSDGQKWRVLSSTEMYDPGTGNFSPIGSMGTPRDGQSATLLNDGRVLIVGGEDIGSQGGVGVASAVLYQP